MALGELVSAGINLLGGLFGGKKKDPTPASNIMSQAEGARAAAERYGFNPLTLLQYGQPGGALGAGGGAPLASNELILGAMRDVSDVLTGESARRRAAADLELELGRVKLDQLRGAVLGVAPSAAGAVGSGAPALGRRAATVVAPAGFVSQPRAAEFNTPRVPGDPVTPLTDKQAETPVVPRWAWLWDQKTGTKTLIPNPDNDLGPEEVLGSQGLAEFSKLWTDGISVSAVGRMGRGSKLPSNLLLGGVRAALPWFHQ